MNLIVTLRNRINKSQFGKNIALIVGGTAFSQALGILFSPIITRIYPPEQYGILTAYTALLALLTISASFDYEKAIPVSEDDVNAVNLLAISFFLLFSFVLILLVVVVFFGDYILSLFDSEILSPYKYLIPLGVFFAGVYNILLQWGFRERNYKIITRTKISQSLTSNFLKVILGLIKAGPIGLIVGTIIGQSAGITSLTTSIFKKKKIIKSINLQEIKYVLIRYKKFPLYSAPSNYVYTAGSSLPVVLLGVLFGPTVIGLYGLANTITYLPVNLIGNSVSQVFYAEAAKLGKNNPFKIKKLAVNLVKKMSIIALVPCIFLLLLGPWIFSLVFGPEWYTAGVYARILSIMIYFHFVITPIGRILEIFECQQKGLLLNIIRLFMIFIVFLSAQVIGLNSFQALTLYSLSNAVTYIAMLFIIMKTLNAEIEGKES